MSDLVTPGEVDAEIDSTSAGHAMGKAGIGAWIVDGADIASVYSSLDETVLNAFNYNTTDSSGLDAVIDPGEAYVSGWLCRDVQTTVTLPASDTVDVYLGYDASAILSSGTAPADNENIIIGLDGDFAAEDPRTHIWTFATDGSSIIDNLDERQLQKPIEHTPNGGLTANADLSLGGGLSVTGSSTFDSTSTFNSGVDVSGSNVDISDGRLDVRDNAAQISIYETDADEQWNVAVSSGNMNLANQSGGSGLLRIFAGGDVEIPNGTLTNERGVNVYTGDPDQGHIFNGSSAPSDSLGRDGDIFVEY